MSTQSLLNNFVSKIKKFFDSNSHLEETNFPLFLNFTSLDLIFTQEEERDNIWSIYSDYADSEGKLSKDTCLTVSKEILSFYSTEESLQPEKSTVFSRLSNYETEGRMSIAVKQPSSKDSFKVLQELRKLFSLIDFKQQPKIFITNIYETVKTYKFIDLDQTNIEDFVEKMASSETKKERILEAIDPITEDMYSNGMSAIEKHFLAFDTEDYLFDSKEPHTLDNAEEECDIILNEVNYCIEVANALENTLSAGETQIDGETVDFCAEKVRSIGKALRKMALAGSSNKDNLSQLLETVKALEKEKSVLREEIEESERTNYFKPEETGKLQELLNLAEKRNRSLNVKIESMESASKLLENKLIESNFESESQTERITELAKRFDAKNDELSKLKEENETLRQKYEDVYEKTIGLEQSKGQSANDVQLTEEQVKNKTEERLEKNMKGQVDIEELKEMRHDSLVKYVLALEKTVRGKETDIQTFKREFSERETEIKELQIKLSLAKRGEISRTSENIAASAKKGLAPMNRLSKLKRNRTSDVSHQSRPEIEGKQDSKQETSEGTSMLELDIKESDMEEEVVKVQSTRHKVSTGDKLTVSSESRTALASKKKPSNKVIQLDYEMIEEEDEEEPRGYHTKQLSKLSLEAETEEKPREKPKESPLKINHTRKKTRQIQEIVTQEVKYNCYDFLSLRKNATVLEMLENNEEDASMYELFSDNIFVIDENNNKTKFYLFISNKSIYLLRPSDLKQHKRFSIRILTKLTLSNKICNLLALHFNGGRDMLIEILRRMELLYYFRDLHSLKKTNNLKFKYSDNFKIFRETGVSTIVVNQANNFFIAPNYENAHKLGYIFKYSTGFFGSSFKEKLVVLTNVGLLYFDDPNDEKPKRIIPIYGSDILKVKPSDFNREHCFTIKTSKKESFIFAANSEEDMEDWVEELRKFSKDYDKKLRGD